MNTALLTRLTRVVRDSAHIAAGSDGTESTLTDGNGRFAAKATLDQFVALFSDLKAPVTNGYITDRAASELGVSLRSAGRYLAAAVQAGRVTQHVDAQRRSTYSTYSISPIAKTTAKAASREQSVSAEVKLARETVSVTLELTTAQHRELAMFAAANNCPLDRAIYVLAARTFENVCQADMSWEDEVDLFRSRYDLYVNRRKSIMRVTANDCKAEDAQRRLEQLRAFAPLDN